MSKKEKQIKELKILIKELNESLDKIKEKRKQFQNPIIKDKITELGNEIKRSLENAKDPNIRRFNDE